ncbi:MAG: hypothetical protein AAF845_08190 [Bacteroidota bacterium]
MTNQPPYEIEWRGHVVGSFEVTKVDMWYMSGQAQLLSTLEARAFSELASGLDLKLAHDDPTEKTRFFLRSDDSSVDALVLSLSDDGRLDLRGVYNREAVEWLRQHVR